MSQTTQGTAPTIPSGMTQVSKAKFWAAVMAEKRDIHPDPLRNWTEWNFVYPRRPWGWTSQGYIERYGELEVFALSAAALEHAPAER